MHGFIVTLAPSAFISKSGTFHIAWFKVTYAHPQLVPDAPQPSSYWAEDDPRSLAAHRGIIGQMVLDFQPLSLVNNKGFVINTRQVAQGVMP